jgi:hypothetical protein
MRLKVSGPDAAQFLDAITDIHGDSESRPHDDSHDKVNRAQPKLRLGELRQLSPNRKPVHHNLAGALTGLLHMTRRPETGVFVVEPILKQFRLLTRVSSAWGRNLPPGRIDTRLPQTQAAALDRSSSSHAGGRASCGT